MEILELVFMTSMSIVCVCGAIFVLGLTVWFLKELIKDFFNNEVKKWKNIMMNIIKVSINQ